ncbi:hypothetical protein BpHYR1_042444 [Brachionus plicatilis]|uniref:Uncharacterized protein n=1 Tax=Brachionus plicatilis TaxID=10195 RepID=A0A3M7QWD2_BRAPC|nr:hypothetical protein BpHYR1_042444 [Brachionus plicatilis]
MKLLKNYNYNKISKHPIASLPNIHPDVKEARKKNQFDNLKNYFPFLGWHNVKLKYLECVFKRIPSLPTPFLGTIKTIEHLKNSQHCIKIAFNSINFYRAVSLRILADKKSKPNQHH